MVTDRRYGLHRPEIKARRAVYFVKVALSVCLIGGLIFSAASPSLALFYVSQNSLRTETFEEAINDPTTNKRVRYVIRLIRTIQPPIQI